MFALCLAAAYGTQARFRPLPGGRAPRTVPVRGTVPQPICLAGLGRGHDDLARGAEGSRVVKRQMLPLSLAATAARSVPSCTAHACSRTWLVASRVAARPGVGAIGARVAALRAAIRHGGLLARSGRAALPERHDAGGAGDAATDPPAPDERDARLRGCPALREVVGPEGAVEGLPEGPGGPAARGGVCQSARAAIRIDPLSYVLAHVEDETGRGNLALSPTVDRAAPLVVAVGRVQWRGPIVNLQVATVEPWAMARGDEAVYSPHDDDAEEAWPCAGATS